MSRNICTIVAKNYLAFARTLCSSFLEHHPDGKCYVLIIDDIAGYIKPEQENFEVVTAQELGIPRLREFCFKYNITELATAFKPYLLSHLFGKGLNSILYLDPDILVTRSLDKLYDELQDHDIIVTPHLDKDYPDDGMTPDDSNIMKSGIYNLGFIGLRNCENARNFLKWWERKLYNKCVVDPCAGYFVDQKFIDLAIVLFPDFAVIHDTGYNAAYWNIHSRHIHKKDGKWMCNDGLLYFYHFSNYKPEYPDVLSGYQNRFSLDSLPGLKELFSDYTRLLKRNDYDASRQWPYSYRNYSNGKRINDMDRIVFRMLMPEIKLDDPFVLESHPSLLRRRILIEWYKRITLYMLSSSTLGEKTKRIISFLKRKRRAA